MRFRRCPRTASDPAGPIRTYAPPTAGYRVSDCNLNGFCDTHEIAVGTSQDCNANGSPDECDILRGTSADCDQNGVPDECEVRGACCLSYEPNDCVMNPTSACCDALSGVYWYEPHAKCENTDCSVAPLRPQ
jgi:hypothetical protein